VLLSGVLASAEAVRARDFAATAAAEATYSAGLPLTATAEAIAVSYQATTVAQESTATALVRVAEAQAMADARLAATATSLVVLAATAEANATAVADAQATYLPRRGLLLSTTLLSLVVQAANVVLLWLIGLALQVPVPAAYYWVLVPVITLLTLLPISLGGIGVRDARRRLPRGAPWRRPMSGLSRRCRRR
jgi:uncharacterized membrane protein YbhN (UPF0104 family)